jgi:phage recombination protein Bet
MSDKPAGESLIKRDPVAVEFIPYGSQDKIKMTVAIVQNLIAVKTKTGKTCSDKDAIRFLAMCQAKRMNPFEGDCFLIGYDGRDGVPNFALVTAHQTYLKRAELHPEFDGMKSGVIVRDDGKLMDLEGDFYDDGQELVGGWATVFFKNRKQPMHKRLKLSRFQKPFGVWQDNPGGMICKCAEADALRSAFPTMLGGLYLREEVELEARKPEYSKPLFNGAQPSLIVDAPVEDVKFEPASEPQPAKPDPQSETPAGFNPIKGVRRLCKMSKIKEGELLTQLAADGTTDGSHGTLEELAMSDGGQEILRAIAENWPDLVARMGKGGDVA